FNPARTRSASGPRLTAAPEEAAVAETFPSSLSDNSASGSGMPGFLQHRVVEIGTDDVLELRIDAFGGFTIIGAVHLDDRHALGLVMLGDLIALGGDGCPPILREIDARAAHR